MFKTLQARLLGDGKNVHSSYRLRRLHRNFPHYVAQFESRYGKFEEQPTLEFRSGIVGQAQVIGDHAIALNDSMINAGIGLFVFTGSYLDNIIKHEIAHLVVNRLVNNANPYWVYIENGVGWMDKSKVGIFDVLNEGSAEYLAIEMGRRKPAYLRESNFVKPVIDKLGKREGIKRLFLEPPSPEELKEPKFYYDKLGV